MKNYNAQNSKQMKIFAFEEVFFFFKDYKKRLV